MFSRFTGHACEAVDWMAEFRQTTPVHVVALEAAAAPGEKVVQLHSF